MKKIEVGQIALFNAKKESQIDGKTIQHIIDLDYDGFLIGFTDGTWGLLQEKGRCQDFTINYFLSCNSAERLNELVKAGVLTPEESVQKTKEMIVKNRKRLLERIESDKRDIEHTQKELAELDKCPMCGK